MPELPHIGEVMDITRQGARASAAHELYLFTGQQTCIDCHKGIAQQAAGHEGRPDLDGPAQVSAKP